MYYALKGQKVRAFSNNKQTKNPLKLIKIRLRDWKLDQRIGNKIKHCAPRCPSKLIGEVKIPYFERLINYWFL